MTRIGGGPKGPSGPKGLAGGGGVRGTSPKFSVGGAAGPSPSAERARTTFLSDVRLLAEAVSAGRISEEVAFERLVQTAVSRRIVGAGAGDTTVIRSVTEIVREDPHLASEVRKLLADATKGKSKT